MSYVITFLFACVAWIAGFFSSYFSTYLTDRRKAIHALVGEIESIRSEFNDYARFDAIHADSIIRLKPLVFAAIPYMRREKQDHARNAWSSYRDLDTNQFYEHGFRSNLAKFVSQDTGEVVITQQEAVDMMLSKLHDTLSVSFPWQ